MLSVLPAITREYSNDVDLMDSMKNPEKEIGAAEEMPRNVPEEEVKFYVPDKKAEEDVSNPKEVSNVLEDKLNRAAVKELVPNEETAAVELVPRKETAAVETIPSEKIAISTIPKWKAKV